ncbi:MAG: hypothetical protein ABEJ91_00755 [Candidatus Nanohaloarchaea archaeon]
MVLEPLVGLFAIGSFALAALLGLVELIGKLYGSFRCLSRRDLTSEQRVIYLVLVWFVPLGWLVYFLLGTERTQQLFADVDIF